jgi:hypothetical protein
MRISEVVWTVSLKYTYICVCGLLTRKTIQARRSSDFKWRNLSRALYSRTGNK